MSLYKLPLILAAALAQLKSITNPHSATSSSTRYSRWDVVVASPSRLTSKILLSIAALAEAAAIVANKYPSLPYAQRILSTLIKPDGSPSAIRFTPLFLLSALLSVSGGLIRWQCYRIMGRMFTFQATIHKDHKLVTSGPYAYVRHPSYTGFIMVYFGILTWHLGAGSWVRESDILSTIVGKVLVGSQIFIFTAVVTALLSRMFQEDEALRKVFGREWDSWAERVPYKVIPGVC